MQSCPCFADRRISMPFATCLPPGADSSSERFIAELLAEEEAAAKQKEKKQAKAAKKKVGKARFRETCKSNAWCSRRTE